MNPPDEPFQPDPSYYRMQISARFDRRLVKVLKGTAEYLDMSFSNLLEGIAVAALHGQCFFGPEVLKHTDKLQSIYGFDKYLDELGDAAEEEGEEGEEE